MANSNLSIGIIGLPNVGKSTLFNALIKKRQALAANYPFTTIEPNIGIVPVPDKRLNRLAEIVKTDHSNKVGDREVPKRIVPAVVKFVDIAGLVKGAHKGEGLGNQFLSHIREVDAIVHVVRDFDDENVARAGSLSPQDDINIVNLELILTDIQTLSKRIDVEQRKARGHDKESFSRLKVYERLDKILNQGRLASALVLSEEEQELINDLNLLTTKPQIFVYNVSENALTKTQSIDMSTNNVYLCAKLEAELSGFTQEDARRYLKEYGLESSNLDKIVVFGYKILNLITFLTMNINEVHAWTIEEGTEALHAAGKVHTDFERGFISAEVINFDDLDKVGSYKQARSSGLVKIEGKNYTIKDGDVVEFRFSV